MKRLVRSLILVAILLPLWYLGFHYMTKSVYGRPTYRLVIEQLQSDPTLAASLAANGLTYFDAGPNAHLAPDEKTGSYSFIATPVPVTPDQIVRKSLRNPMINPFTITKAELDAEFSQVKPGAPVFNVYWQEDPVGHISIIRIEFRGRTIYAGPNRNSEVGNP